MEEQSWHNIYYLYLSTTKANLDVNQRRRSNIAFDLKLQMRNPFWCLFKSFTGLLRENM